MKTSDTVFRKIYLSLYLKGLCVRGSWRPNRTAIYWPPLLWPSPRFFPVLLSFSNGDLGAQPFWVLFFSTASYLQLVWSPTAQSGAWGLLLLGAGFLYHILSPTGLVSKLSIGGPEASSAGYWLSLPHLVSNWSGLQTNWLPVFTELHNSSTPPSSCGRHNCTHSTHPRSRL